MRGIFFTKEVVIGDNPLLEGCHHRENLEKTWGHPR
jgi:hypothetical protein